jgi:hypothetical protein
MGGWRGYWDVLTDLGWATSFSIFLIASRASKISEINNADCQSECGCNGREIALCCWGRLRLGTSRRDVRHGPRLPTGQGSKARTNAADKNGHRQRERYHNDKVGPGACLEQTFGFVAIAKGAFRL